MSHSHSTVVVRLTPPGRSAVATLLLAGDDALALVRSRFSGGALVPDKPVFGRFRIGDTSLAEEIVAHLLDSNRIELHTHGSEAVLSRIEAIFAEEGAVALAWKDWLLRDGVEETCRSKQKAFAMLPFAKTERTAKILLDQCNGALERELQAIRSLPEPEAKKRWARLEENRRLGRHLTEPFSVVLSGASNAGKSSLLNAILGFGRTIVDASPGTTRDVVAAETALDGWPVRFLDTAGVRETDHPIEREGIDRGVEAVRFADLVLRIIDLSSATGETVLPHSSERTLTVFSKCDLPEVQERLQAFDNPLAVSGKDSIGLSRLLENISRRLVPSPPGFQEAVPLD